MIASKQIFDATPSTLGTIYHFLVVVERCCDLEKGEKLYIEQFGDITINAQSQIEVKHYSDNLTDSHKNLWGTLKNWISASFNPDHYSSLILLSTQEFGPDANIKEWNWLSAPDRLKLLRTILAENEKAQAAKKLADPKSKPSAMLELQRIILAPSNEKKLKKVVGKVYISTSAKTADDVINSCISRRATGIKTGLKKTYIASLLGHILLKCAATTAWEITKEEFDKHAEDLHRKLGVSTVSFPQKTTKSLSPPPNIKSYSFVSKVEDIAYHSEVPRAIENYVSAMHLIQHEFSNYDIPLESYSRFSETVMGMVAPKIQIARRNTTPATAIRDAQNLYDECMSAPVPAFPGCEVPDIYFRNGVIHINFNDGADYRWKL